MPSGAGHDATTLRPMYRPRCCSCQASAAAATTSVRTRARRISAADFGFSPQAQTRRLSDFESRRRARRSFEEAERANIMKTIGVDVGGTFTDIVYCDLDSGQVAIHKVSTTPDDPARGVTQGIAEICRDNGVSASDIDYALHGTTTATNAVLGHKGARSRTLTKASATSFTSRAISASSTIRSCRSCRGRTGHW